MSAGPLPVSFSDLALYAACPLRYRQLEVDRLSEPDVESDWSRAPRALPPAAVASPLDRVLGVAVHAALTRWQRAVDAGGKRSASALLLAVRREAAAALPGVAATRLAAAVDRLEHGLTWYASGPWPRRGTVFLEQRAGHVMAAADGFALELRLRVDRVARFSRGVAILDFKTVTPHRDQLRADSWQLRAYALAAPELLGIAASRCHLFLLDLQRGAEVAVAADAADLAAAEGELLAAGRGIAAAEYGVEGHPDRPCWSCGFRLECPASLAPTPPRPRRPATHRG